MKLDLCPNCRPKVEAHLASLGRHIDELEHALSSATGYQDGIDGRLRGVEQQAREAVAAASACEQHQAMTRRIAAAVRGV